MLTVLRTARKVAGVIVAALLVATVVGLAGLFWLVRQDGWLVQSVATGSMEPTIPTGSVILSRPVAPEEIEVGDVIVFASPTGATVAAGGDGAFESDGQMLITHRVVGVETDGGLAFRTKGDGNDAEDPWMVTPEMLRARYVGHVPVLGGIVSHPDLRRWLYLAVAAAGVVVIVAEGRSMARELRKTPGSDLDAGPDPEPDIEPEDAPDDQALAASASGATCDS